MGEPRLFKPKLTEAQRKIVLRALRRYIIEVIRDLDKRRPIGPDMKAEADYLEAAFTLYRRFRETKIGRPYPHWWLQSYDSRLIDVYRELLEDERADSREEETAKSPEA